jgi:hypothetical protein
MTMSHDHQVLADDDPVLEKFRDRLAPCVVADAVDRGGKVRERKRFDTRFLSEAADIFGRVWSAFVNVSPSCFVGVTISATYPPFNDPQCRRLTQKRALTPSIGLRSNSI